MTEQQHNIARLWFSRHTGEWVAWDQDGHLIARDRDKATVIRLCEQAGYQVVEV